MKEDEAKCPHCGGKMSKWETADISSWGPGFQYVCFNDECPYYVRGWKWMKEKFNQDVSYRHRLDPRTGESGPLPVYSAEALRSGIIREE